ncbi:MAG: YceD family protein [Chloroflexota bacterium]
MKIDVTDLLKQPVGSILSCTVDDAVEGLDGEQYDVAGKVELLRINGGILMRAAIDTFLGCACSRCLESFDYPMSLSIVEEFLPSNNASTGPPMPVPSNAGVFAIDEDGFLDTSEVIRQHIVMSLPMQPICRESCVGLCPACGHNLNEGTCGCGQKDEDSRWRKLREWNSGGNSETREKGT